jgi:AGCS family alanine or glycine:cation symporter
VIDSFFTILEGLDNITWSYLATPILIILGLYFSIASGFVQVRKFPSIIKMFFGFLTEQPASSGKIGIKPIHAFFASVGGCIGIGNIVVICTAIQIGGPGALFWVWITALFGAMLKYSEVYLGMRYRVTNPEGTGYSGGPMYYLQKVVKNRWLPVLVCGLLCLYGAEPFLFGVITHSISTNLELSKPIVIATLLILIVLASSGGVKRIGQISSKLIPLFIIMYLGMSFWVIGYNFLELPAVLYDVLASAFTGHAAVGGFVGSGLMAAMSQGVRRGCYSSDIGTGYPSVIHSESSEKRPEKQAILAIVDVFLDTLVCTTTVLLILVTGIWKEPLHESLLVQTALGSHFPWMHLFIPFFVFLLGYSTMIVIFCVGIKCARYIGGKTGERVYYAYAIVSWIAFAYVETAQVLIIMSFVQGLLLVINCYGIYRLRKEVSFDFEAEELPVNP